MVGHSTTDCEGLKRDKEAQNAKTPEAPPKKNVEQAYDVFMVEGEPSAQRVKRRRMDNTIFFGIDEPSPVGYQGDEPLLIKGTIGPARIRRIYVDTGASANIMYEQCFFGLPEKARGFLRPATNSVVGFAGQSVWPKGNIHLPITFYDHASHRSKTILAEFIVIEAPSAYNIIWGRSGLRQLRAIASTVHGTMKIPDPEGTITLVSEAKPRCFQAEVKATPQGGESSRGAEEAVVVHPGFPDQPIKIGRSLGVNMRG